MLILVSAKTQILVNNSVLEKHRLHEQTMYFELKSLTEEQAANFKDPQTVDKLKKQYLKENQILKQALENQWNLCDT